MYLFMVRRSSFLKCISHTLSRSNRKLRTYHLSLDHATRSKIKFFKQASRVSNLKNVAQSVARRRQRWLCYQLAKCDLLGFPLECGPGDTPSPLSSEPDSIHEHILHSNPAVDTSSSVFRPSWVRYEGVVYKANNCYLIKESDGLDIRFVKLAEILVISNSLVTFVVHDCRVLYFDNHYHAYAVELTPSMQKTCMITMFIMDTLMILLFTLV